MQLAVRGKNMEVTNALREYLEKKVGKVGRLIDEDISAQVMLYVHRGRHIVEVTAMLHGLLLRGHEATDDMYASIDGVADKLERQVHKYKKRIRRQRGRENGQSEAVAPVADAGTDEEQDSAVVKTKRFPIKPVPVDEASLQMEMLGHDFFVFRNSESMEINVLYKRKDGDYGLLIPDA